MEEEGKEMEKRDEDENNFKQRRSNKFCSFVFL